MQHITDFQNTAPMDDFIFADLGGKQLAPLWAANLPAATSKELPTIKVSEAKSDRMNSEFYYLLNGQLLEVFRVKHLTGSEYRLYFADASYTLVYKDDELYYV